MISIKHLGSRTSYLIKKMYKNLNLISEWSQILLFKYVSNKYQEKSINKSHQDHSHNFGLIHQFVGEWRVKFKTSAPNISTKVIIVIIIILSKTLLPTNHNNLLPHPDINFKFIIITTHFNIHIQVYIYFRLVANGSLSTMLLVRISLLLFFLIASFFKRETVEIVSIVTL